MGDDSSTFNWVQFPEGRARFAGATRGWDERRYEVFCVEVNGVAYFGEIARLFLPNDDDFNIEVRSFGYCMDANVGIPDETARESFEDDDLRIVRSLICQLVSIGRRLETRRPSLLTEYQNSRFMGQVIFRDGWAQNSGAAVEVAAFPSSEGGVS